jgi:hypothetical protein
MRKTKLPVTHPEVTSEKLDDFVSGRGPIRVGLRIAILQGVMDKAPIDQMSRRHNLSRLYPGSPNTKLGHPVIAYKDKVRSR